MQPAPAPAPPSPPAPPVPPAAPALAGVAQSPALPATAVGVPRTAQDLALLRARRTELSNQLTSANGRRRELARALDRAEPGQDRAGLEQRMAVLDARILQLENDIAVTGKLVIESPALATGQGVPWKGATPNVSGDVLGPLVALLLLFPLVLAFARRIWRRGGPVLVNAAALPAADSARLARLEQAVDAIAVEMERVSEGQRFLTRVLGEQRERVALGMGDDEERGRR